MVYPTFNLHWLLLLSILEGLGNGACGAPFASRISFLVCFTVLTFFIFNSKVKKGPYQFESASMEVRDYPDASFILCLIISKLYFFIGTIFTVATMSSRLSRTIYVGNLPIDIRESEVEDLFRKVSI